jgi:hypothetical protein
MRRPELRLVQSALESVLAPELALQTFREAVGAAGAPPASTAELISFLHGPLRAALERRLGGPTADTVVDDLLGALAPRAEEPRTASTETTRELPIETAQVSVVVLSASPALATGLVDALGPERVAPSTAGSVATAVGMLAARRPALVLVDGAAFPSIEPRDLPDLLGELPRTTVRALWGTDTPYGAAALAALVERRAPVTPLDRREGLAPIVDLVRARRFAG